MKNVIPLCLFVITTVVNYAQPMPPVKVEDCLPLYFESFDGIDDDWRGPETQELNIFSQSGEADWEGESDFSIGMKFGWDVRYFYTFVEITDDIEHSWNGTDGSAWGFDNVEWYFQLDTQTVPSTYSDNTIQIRFNRGEANFQSSTFREGITQEDFEWYSANTEYGWVLECGIPWTNIMPDGSLPEDFIEWIADTVGCSVYYRRLIGFDFHASDSDGSDSLMGNRESGTQMAWDQDNPWNGDEEGAWDGTEDLAWNNTSVFGYLNLQGGHYDCMGPSDPPDFINHEHAGDNPREIHLHPNPVNNVLYLSSADQYRSLSIYASTGERVAHLKINGHSINVSSLKPGLYIAVFDGSEVVKFIKK